MGDYPGSAWFERYRSRVNADPEMNVIGDWFSTTFTLRFGDNRHALKIDKGKIIDIIASPRLDVRATFGFAAPINVWEKFLSPNPPPLFHDFFAMLMRVPEFTLEGDSLIALQNARALHRMMNIMREIGPMSDLRSRSLPDSEPSFEPITGRYIGVDIERQRHRIFVEEAGRGPPLLCLHTAGNDSRQFRHMMNDRAVTERFRIIAFDMPYHGRSAPPDGWWLKKFRLTTKSYLDIIRSVWLALGLERPILLGCSMGGAIVLRVAADYQDEISGIVGLESSAYAPGRYNEFLHHPAIHGGELCASYTYGLNSPYSPEVSRRENWWYYSQSGPGVYQGDVYFYSIDWDAREDIKRIDTTRCKVVLLTGEYDYSCTPAMTEAVAQSIPGACYVLMKGMGHFPMIENYPDFRPYLLDALDHITSARPAAPRAATRSPQ